MLTDTEKAMLATERVRWQYSGAKEQYIRDKFGMSITRYYQAVNALIEREDALAHDPHTTRLLLRRRTQRQRSRAGRVA